MKLVILTAMHHRHELNKIFGMAMSRIRDRYDVETHCVISTGDAENTHICDEYGISWVTAKNNPISNKFNVGMQALRDRDWTHVMILGSDDIPSNSFMEIQMQGAIGHDLAMINDMWFWGLNPKRAGWDKFYYFPAGSSRIGAGRVVSRRVVEACDYAIWPPDRNAGLDGASVKRMKSAVNNMKLHGVNLKDAGGFLVDIKYELHISSLSPVERLGKEDDVSMVNKSLPFNEADALFRLREKIKKENYL